MPGAGDRGQLCPFCTSHALPCGVSCAEWMFWPHSGGSGHWRSGGAAGPGWPGSHSGDRTPRRPLEAQVPGAHSAGLRRGERGPGTGWRACGPAGRSGVVRASDPVCGLTTRWLCTRNTGPRGGGLEAPGPPGPPTRPASDRHPRKQVRVPLSAPPSAHRLPRGA